MATSLLGLLDDIATILDDVSVMAKVAVKKTAGVLGDDLALNAEQVAGVVSERELPVVWAVAKGSFVNKLILVPTALLISAVIPSLIIPLLMFGGLFLCFEGFEKLAHKYLHKNKLDEFIEPQINPADLEKEKIKGAIRTDFILSAEIIVISLGTVAGAPMTQQVLVVSGIAILMTIGVYGLVAAIVKLDDLGYYLLRSGRRLQKLFGQGLLFLAPRLMKTLSIVGTAAMFLVGGGILSHGLGLHVESLQWDWILPHLLHLGVGLVAGAVALGIVIIFKKLRKV